MVSPLRGIFFATLYGGPKSKLRSLVQPFNSGLLYFYEDETRHFIKISDFDVKQSHFSFRTDIYKMMAANLAGEILIKTKCAGDYEKAFILFRAFLDGTEASSSEDSKSGLIRFLWRYLTLMGIQPDVNRCIECSLPISTETSKGGTYIRYLNGFVCSECLQTHIQNTKSNKGSALHIKSSSLFYLNAVSSLKPQAVRSIPLAEESYNELKELLFLLIENAAGTFLHSLETARGII